jgi:hypothetical protein
VVFLAFLRYVKVELVNTAAMQSLFAGLTRQRHYDNITTTKNTNNHCMGVVSLLVHIPLSAPIQSSAAGGSDYTTPPFLSTRTQSQRLIASKHRIHINILDKKNRNPASISTSTI